MREFSVILATCLALSSPATAHEFWIEPVQPASESERSVNVRVLVGEDFEGKVFPFEPRAYQAAFWIGPERTAALHSRPLAAGNVPLEFQHVGLHILVVASYPTTHVYDDPDDFLAFAMEIGALETVALEAEAIDQATKIREKYSRFSKTLIRHGERGGEDRRIGLEYEWVQSAGGLTLFAGTQTKAHHPVDIYCKHAGEPASHGRYRTDADGHVAYTPIDGQRCLINAVFLHPPEQGGEWSSDWVSLTWSHHK